METTRGYAYGDAGIGLRRWPFHGTALQSCGHHTALGNHTALGITRHVDSGGTDIHADTLTTMETTRGYAYDDAGIRLRRWPFHGTALQSCGHHTALGNHTALGITRHVDTGGTDIHADTLTVKDCYARFSLGNLYFIDGSTPAPSWTQDLEGRGGALGVLMGKNPRLVHLPDNALFAQFMAAIRQNPDKLKRETRFTIIAYLADTGEIFTERQINKLKQNKAQYQLEFEAPRWIEENGTLVIDYYSYRIEEEYHQVVVKCQLRVDSSQQYTITCEPVPYHQDSEISSENTRI